MTRTRLTSLAAVAAAAALGACSAVTGPGFDAGRRDSGGTSCSGVGCAAEYVITLLHEGSWPAGTYELVIVADCGATTTCAVTLPSAGGCAAAPVSRCSPAGVVQIGPAGCTLFDAQRSLVNVGFTGGASPTAVRVTVSRDGSSLVEGSFAPAYTTIQPNGRGCEPTCRQARDILAVP